MNKRKEPVWIRSDALVVVAAQSIMYHGGTHGSVKYDLLESALHKPQHIWHYEQIDDLFVLAAAYAMGISQNHPFTDGNKRAAYLAIGLFLEDNGYEVIADPKDAYHAIMHLAKGELDQTMLAAWIEKNSEAVR